MPLLTKLRQIHARSRTHDLANPNGNPRPTNQAPPKASCAGSELTVYIHVVYWYGTLVRYTGQLDQVRTYCCSRRDADGDGVLPAADGARGPWQRTLAGNGCIGRTLAPVLRGRVGIADEGGDRPGGLRHHPSRVLVRTAFCLTRSPRCRAQHAVRTGCCAT